MPPGSPGKRARHKGDHFMKAVILAAGRGTRMRGVFGDLPKALIPLNNVPFLKYLFNNLHAAGITDIGIIVNYQKEKIAEFLASAKIPATLIRQPGTKGTGAAVASAEEFVGRRPFLVVSGDNLYSGRDLKRISSFRNAVGVVQHEEPQHFGVIKEQRGTLKEIVEKPQKFIGNKINTGLYSMTEKIFPYLKRLAPSPRGEIELTDAINQLAKKTEVAVVELKDYFIDIGNPEQVKFAEAFIRRLQEEKCL